MTNEPYISAHPDPPGESPYGLQCVVNEASSFTDASLAHALSISVLNYLDLAKSDAEMALHVARWKRGRIRKIMRRARNARWEKLGLEEGLTTIVGTVEIRVFTPSAIDNIPTLIKRSQVSGIVSEGEGLVSRPETRPCLQVFTNKLLNMSPGKTAVAAAHVAQLMSEQLLPDDYDLWKNNGFPMGVASNGLMGQWLERYADVTINDGGLTEVEPGSLTANGFWME